MTIEDKTNTSVGKRAKFQEPYGPVIDTFRLTFKSKKLTRLRKYFARHVGKRIIVLGFCNVEKFSAAIESVPMKKINDRCQWLACSQRMGRIQRYNCHALNLK